MRRRILVLDTGHLIGEKRCRAVLDKKYEMCWACPSDDVLWRDVMKEVDLLLLDLDVPWPPASALLPEILKAHRSLFVLGFTERSNLSKLAGASGVGALVEKPFEVLGLVRLIDDLLMRTLEDRQRCRVLLPSASQQKGKSGIPIGKCQFRSAASYRQGLNG